MATIAIIAVVIVAIVAGLYFYMDWQRNRPTTPPEQIEVTASAAGTDITTKPFSICEFGEECPEGEVATINAGDADNIRITVPQDLAELQWSLLSIYDDPAANTERTFTPREATEVDVPVIAEAEDAEDAAGAKLVVIEVSCLMLGTDADGNETPVMATWSFGVE